MPATTLNTRAAKRRPAPYRPTIALIVIASIMQALSVAAFLGVLVSSVN